MSEIMLSESVKAGILSAITVSIFDVGIARGPASVFGFTANVVRQSSNSHLSGYCAGVIVGTFVTKFIAEPKMDVYKAVHLTIMDAITGCALTLLFVGAAGALVAIANRR